MALPPEREFQTLIGTVKSEVYSMLRYITDDMFQTLIGTVKRRFVGRVGDQLTIKVSNPHRYGQKTHHQYGPKAT